MSDWLDPIRDALADRSSPLRCFVRDDDGGWNDPALMSLLDVAEDRGVVIDVAVIPAAIDAGADALRRRVERGAARVHQHGYRHADHALTGRKCEFGESRTRRAIRADLERGRSELSRRFGASVDPIFTPPWNRCSATTAIVLEELGFAVLSRESGAERFDRWGLCEVPVTFDWSSRRTPTLEDRGRSIAEQVRSLSTIGLMFHHAVTNGEELRAIGQLFDLLATSPIVTMTTILDVAERQPAGT